MNDGSGQPLEPPGTGDPIIDVLIPAFNVATTIRASIESIQRQTIRDIRIVVVNDGSTDETGTILSAIAAQDPRVHLITTENGGIVDALNTGLAVCRARYIARHDGDDIAAPNRFETQIGYLEANSDCIAVAGAARQIDVDGRPLGTFARLRSPNLADLNYVPAREPYLLHPFLMLRHESLTRVDGYRYAFHAEDSDLYWRLQEIGRLHNMDEVLGDYRISAGSVTGISVVNGRISALNSQLAALSARRRRPGRPDLQFKKDTAEECMRARNLPAIFEIGCRQLEPDEINWLRLALAAKLLELAGYRPYELELRDCKFIRGALAMHFVNVQSGNRAELLRMWSGTVARLAAGRRLAEATALASPRIYHLVLARLALRLMTPTTALRLLRQRAGRDTYFK